MRRKLLFIIGFVGLVAGAAIFMPEPFDRDLFWASFRATHPGWIAASVGTTFLGYAIRALRWQTLLTPIKHISFLHLMSATVIGFGAIFSLGRPGEVVRPVWINRVEGVPIVGGATSVIVERVFDLLMVLVLFVVASGRIETGREALELAGSERLWQLAVLVAVCLLGFFAAHRFADRIGAFLPALRSVLETFRRGLAATSSVRGVGIVTGYSVLLWLVHTLQFWLILEGLGLSYPVAAITLTLVLTSLGSIVQIPGIGGGFQAGFILAATTVLDVPAEVAIAASLMVWFITTIPTILAAGGYMLWKGISFRDLSPGETGLSTS
jgi:uncharacterized protein (TIRG00374 family)